MFLCLSGRANSLASVSEINIRYSKSRLQKYARQF